MNIFSQLFNGAVNIISAIFSFQMIGGALVLIVIMFASVYGNYSKLNELDSQYHYTASSEFIRISSGPCEAILNRNDLSVQQIIPITFDSASIYTKTDCSQVLPSIQKYVAQHDEMIRGIDKTNNLILWPICFIIFCGLVFVNIPLETMKNKSKKGLIVIIGTWLVLSTIILVPVTFGNYSPLSITDNGTNSVSIEDGYITNDGKWLALPRTYYEQLMFCNIGNPIVIK